MGEPRVEDLAGLGSGAARGLEDRAAHAPSLTWGAELMTPPHVVVVRMKPNHRYRIPRILPDTLGIIKENFQTLLLIPVRHPLFCNILYWCRYLSCLFLSTPRSC